MSSNVFLAPCDPGNFGRTVIDPVNATEYDTAPPVIADNEEAVLAIFREHDRHPVMNRREEQPFPDCPKLGWQ